MSRASLNDRDREAIARLPVKGHQQVEPMLVVSTAHLTREDAQRLDEGTHAYKETFKRDEGYVFHTRNHANPDACCGDPSESMLLCFRRADSLGCDWLMFDCDADVIEDIPHHDW